MRRFLPLLLAITALSATAQTVVLDASVSGPGGSGSGISSGTLAAIPATCTVGASYIATDTLTTAITGSLYFCTATNTWTQFLTAGSSGAITITNGVVDVVPGVLPQLNLNNAFAGSNSFAGTTTVNNLTVTGTCTGCGGGGGSWSSLTSPTANQSLTMGAFTTTQTWGASTGANNLVTLADTTNNTGTGFLLDLESAAGSSTNQIRIKSSNTTGVNINYTACSTNACGYFGVAGPNRFPVGGAGGPGSTFVAADNDILFTTGGGNGRWGITSGGNLITANEVSLFNIGSPGANRPGNVYVQKKVAASNFISSVNTVTFSATPTCDFSLGDVQTMTLSNISAGQRIVFDFLQDVSGNRTVAFPAAVHGATAPGTVASKHNVQEFYSPDGTNLYAVASGVTNQ
jgi:hypothetical protein